MFRFVYFCLTNIINTQLRIFILNHVVYLDKLRKSVEIIAYYANKMICFKQHQFNTRLSTLTLTNRHSIVIFSLFLCSIIPDFFLLLLFFTEIELDGVPFILQSVSQSSLHLSLYSATRLALLSGFISIVYYFLFTLFAIHTPCHSYAAIPPANCSVHIHSFHLHNGHFGLAF